MVKERDGVVFDTRCSVVPYTPGITVNHLVVRVDGVIYIVVVDYDRWRDEGWCRHVAEALGRNDIVIQKCSMPWLIVKEVTTCENQSR